MAIPQQYIPEEESLDQSGIDALQRSKLATMLARVLPGNAFYRRKLEGVRFDPFKDPITALPFTTRQELERDQIDHLPYGTNLSAPIERFSRFHQTSGSGGRPL